MRSDSHVANVRGNDGGRGRNCTLSDAGLESAALPMSYTPVPAGGIEPPHDGATTRCLPTWLSRQNLVAEAGIEPRPSPGQALRLTRRMKPPLYRLSYSAV